MEIGCLAPYLVATKFRNIPQVKSQHINCLESMEGEGMYSFSLSLTLMLAGGGVNATPRPPPGMKRYSLYGRLGGPHGRSGQVRKISPPSGFDLQTVQPIASREYAIPTHQRTTSKYIYWRVLLYIIQHLLEIQCHTAAVHGHETAAHRDKFNRPVLILTRTTFSKNGFTVSFWLRRLLKQYIMLKVCLRCGVNLVCSQHYYYYYYYY
jgi:hypothetical protein